MGAGTVTKEQLKKLVGNYYQKMGKKKKGGTKHDPLDTTKDTRSVWFQKQNLDELFAENGYRNDLPDDEKKKYGLRIYFGVHDKDTILTDIPEGYDNQQMVILYVTKKESLANNVASADVNSLDVPGSDVGMGMNHGKLCPPDSGCGEV